MSDEQLKDDVSNHSADLLPGHVDMEGDTDPEERECVCVCVCVCEHSPPL